MRYSSWKFRPVVRASPASSRETVTLRALATTLLNMAFSCALLPHAAAQESSSAQPSADDTSPGAYHLPWDVQAQLHGSFLSDVADRSQIQNTFGYAGQLGYRWDTWGLFGRIEHNLWIASEFSRSVETGAFNIGIGGEYLFFRKRMRASVAFGPSVLLFSTGIDDPGSVGVYLDVRPSGIRWALSENVLVQWDPLTFSVVAPVLSGIPLVMLEYRTALSFAFDWGQDEG